MISSWKHVKNNQNNPVVYYSVHSENKTGIIKISRKKYLNALNNIVIKDLSTALGIMEDDREIRSIIIMGAGDKAFVAGADIKEFQNFKKEEAHHLSQKGKESLFKKIQKLKKPVIAAVNGYALGGGLELALSCHIRVSSDNAKLGFPECTLGIIPGYNGTQMLPKTIGLGNAFEMILTGKIIDSQEAHRIGLVNHCVSSGVLLEKCFEITKSFNKASPEALRSAIKATSAFFLREGEEIESKEFSELFETSNFKEGVSAFLDKRKSDFK